MRFVVLGSLLGFLVAVAGLALFGMSWPMAAAAWLLGGPIGAVLALASALVPSYEGAEAPVAAPESQVV